MIGVKALMGGYPGPRRYPGAGAARGNRFGEAEQISQTNGATQPAEAG